MSSKQLLTGLQACNKLFNKDAFYREFVRDLKVWYAIQSGELRIDQAS